MAVPDYGDSSHTPPLLDVACLISGRRPFPADPAEAGFRLALPRAFWVVRLRGHLGPGAWWRAAGARLTLLFCEQLVDEPDEQGVVVVIKPRR